MQHGEVGDALAGKPSHTAGIVGLGPGPACIASGPVLAVLKYWLRGTLGCQQLDLIRTSYHNASLKCNTSSMITAYDKWDTHNV